MSRSYAFVVLLICSFSVSFSFAQSSQPAPQTSEDKRAKKSSTGKPAKQTPAKRRRSRKPRHHPDRSTKSSSAPCAGAGWPRSAADACWRHRRTRRAQRFLFWRCRGRRVEEH